MAHSQLAVRGLVCCLLSVFPISPKHDGFDSKQRTAYESHNHGPVGESDVGPLRSVSPH